jgi:FKBP-type peptidyl-prolyl cis-trans isomerase (trigger factor)
VKREARLSLEDYLHVRGQTVENLREEFEPRAADRLKRGLVLGEITMREGLEVNEEEIGTHIEEVSATWGARADEVRASLSAGAGRQTVHNRLLADKAVQRLVAIARGEAPEPASAGESEDREAEGQGAGSKEQEAGNQEAQEQEEAQ